MLLVNLLLTVIALTQDDLNAQLSHNFGQIYVASAITGATEFPPISSSIPTKIADQILQTWGVDSNRSSALLFAPLAPPPYPYASPQVLAVGIQRGKEKSFLKDLKTIDGNTSLTSDNAAILGYEAARFYHVHVGEDITIANYTFKIIGILEQNNLLINSIVMIPLEAAQNIFSRENTVSAVLLTVKNINDYDNIVERLRKEYPTLTIISNKDMSITINKIQQGATQYLNFTNTFIIVIAILMITAYMTLSVSQRIHEIGILRSLGMSRRTIFFSILEESVMICLVGGVAAMLATILLLLILYHGISALKPLVFAESLVMAFMSGIISGLIPAYFATKVNVIEAIRYE
jgi:ABC-type antimicrobial peptide transport system permease subunit